MIPEFPEFKKLELEDKKEVEKFTSQFPPYSDFSFVSMWAWDIKGEMRISHLNGNLIVRFTDYITGEPFYSFLGINKVNETAELLLKLSEKEKITTTLQLIPEEVIQLLDTHKFKIQEDPNHFDYVYSTDELRKLEGGKFARKRNQVSLFLKNHEHARAEKLDLKDKNIQASITNLFLNWLSRKIKLMGIYESHEEVAVNRLLLAIDEFKLIGTGVFVGEKLIGFFINELAHLDYVIAHASKIDNAYEGVNSYLMKENAKLIHSLGKNYFNYEQDLGVENLRIAKTRFRPALFLKKYSISRH